MKNKQMMSHLLRASSIARRYLVTNGFDGALTMVGMLTGFYISGTTELSVAISACLGAAVALFISGLTSAYLSEKAERKKELHELEQAMVHDLKASDYEQASHYLPLLIALVNGVTPLLLSLLILLPLFAAEQGYSLAFSPFINAIVVALICIFFLGVFLGKVSQSFWLWAGLRTLVIAILTMAIILFFVHPAK